MRADKSRKAFHGRLVRNHNDDVDGDGRQVRNHDDDVMVMGGRCVTMLLTMMMVAANIY